MRTRVPYLLLTVTIVVTLLGSTATAAGAHPAIAPHQHFRGLVNGRNKHAVVLTACPGPVATGVDGAVLSAQTLSVAPDPNGAGYTGPFSQVYAWFVPASTGPRPVTLTFTTYWSPQPIPSSVRVPCSGTGQVEFSPCPYLAPCAAGFVPDIVTVRFADVAA